MNQAILSVRGLSKDYGNGQGCFDVNFQLYPGEVLCIVGESGSGKSTLLSTLAGRLAADAGSVRFADRDGVTHELTC
ncbi:ATP-binding cassette domain-containing protein, partial (plasmid) [Chromobacterium amazonense]|uniref:ATP-binding cassette domain-containing protein n=1 Tax=Chromobacterium amazonense TaxID=1382803 RepID=UPI00237EBDD5